MSQQVALTSLTQQGLNLKTAKVHEERQAAVEAAFAEFSLTYVLLGCAT